MRILCDSASGVSVFFEQDETRARIPDSVDGALWEAFDTGSVLGGVYETAAGFDGWDVCLVEDFAQSSQWDRILSLPSSFGRRGLMCVARTGVGFHGKGGRHWYSPPGNLYFCGMVRLDGIDPKSEIISGSMLSRFIASVLVSGFGEGLCVAGANDLMYDERKLGGVLCAVEIYPGNEVILRFGIGLNVNFAPDLGPGTSRESCCFWDINRYDGISTGEVFKITARLLSGAPLSEAVSVGGY